MNDEKVVSVDFGKTRREACHAFARLLGLFDAQNAELMENPVRLFDLAGAELYKRDQVLREAREALRPRILIPCYDRGPIPFMPLRTVQVDAAEYDRLRKCAQIVERGIDG
jgi:hypothetical protein